MHMNADYIVFLEDGNLPLIYPASMIGQPKPGGKGRLVAEYAKTVGARLEFSSYHAGWVGFNS